MAYRRYVLMGSILGLLGLIMGLYAQPEPSPAAAAGLTYELVWQEDFEGDELDATSWNKIERNKPDWCKYMTSHDGLYELKHGRMRLFGKRNLHIDPSDTAKYLTGGISTLHKRTFTYGKVEVRARMKGVKGCWPAIWIKDDSRDTPNYKALAEIDVVEYYNEDDVVWCNIHNAHTLTKKQTKDPVSSASAKIRKNRYNVYAIEILPDRLIWSVNGVQQFVYPRIEKYGFDQFPYGSPCYLMLDMQIGNPWLKEIDDASLPSYMDIDWVKFYELKR